MALTEIIILTARALQLTPEWKRDTEHMLRIQDEWRSNNAPLLPKDRKGRAEYLYQQVEDPSVYLLATHWGSVYELQQWRNSDEGKCSLALIEHHFDSETASRFHLQDAALFAAPGAESETGLSQSAVISVGRCFIGLEHRKDFERNKNSVMGFLEDFARPYVVRGAWKFVEQPDADQEFVFMCGWPSVERHMEFAKSEHFPTYASGMKEFVKGFDVKHYQRIL
ncbi:hypothetical protein BX600DRAFT_448470 [Xylariales sp. PMI_506]|nr:hypothetical protein BX600DRAFT_448470 [Xylariales sp. PMI_506]